MIEVLREVVTEVVTEVGTQKVKGGVQDLVNVSIDLVQEKEKEVAPRTKSQEKRKPTNTGMCHLRVLNI